MHTILHRGTKYISFYLIPLFGMSLFWSFAHPPVIYNQSRNREETGLWLSHTSLAVCSYLDEWLCVYLRLCRQAIISECHFDLLCLRRMWKLEKYQWSLHILHGLQFFLLIWICFWKEKQIMEKGKRNIFLFCFYMDKVDENSFRV